MPKFFLLTFFFSILAALLIGFIFGVSLSHQDEKNAEGTVTDIHVPLIRAKNPESFKDIDLEEFWRVWKTLEQRFVPSPKQEGGILNPSPEDLPTREDFLTSAIKGLTYATGDPFSVYLPPVDSKEFNREIISGDIEGIGVYIGVRNGVLTVISPIKNTPAHKAGLKSRDIILEIDGNATKDLGVIESSKLIRGKVGTMVTLKIARAGEKTPLEVSIKRGVIETPNIETEIKDDVFVIKVNSFNKKTPTLFKEAMLDFVKSGTDKLILDMRNNPGGILEVAVYIASFFIQPGEPVLYQYNGSGKLKIYKSQKISTKFLESKPNVMVIINGGSASASEILAGALKHYGVAKIFGTPSYGKGSVQELIPIANGSTLKLTIAHWLLPDKSSLSHKGLEVDIEYEAEGYVEGFVPFDDEKDEMLEYAIGIINK